MSCRKIRQYLSQYYRGELSKEEEKLVTRHIQVCQGCAREAQTYKALNHAIQNLEEYKPSPVFESKLEGRIRETSYSQREAKSKATVTTFPSLRWAFIPAVVTVLALFLLFKGGVFKSKTELSSRGTDLAEVEMKAEESRKDTMPVEDFFPQVDVQKAIPVNFVRVRRDIPKAVFIMDNLRYSDLQIVPDSKILDKGVNNYVMDAVSYRAVDDIQANEAYVLPAVSTFTIEEDRSY